MLEITENAESHGKYKKSQKMQKIAGNVENQRKTPKITRAFQLPAWVPRPERPKAAKDEVGA